MPSTPPIITPLPRVTNNSLEFWWQPPADTGGYAVVSYSLVSNVEPFDKYEFSPSIFNYRVDGLTPGTEYTFYISCDTDEPFTSDPAYFVPSIPGLKASNPISTTSTTYNNNTGLVTWNPPDSDGGATIKYYVLRSKSYESGGYSNVTAVPASASSASVSTIASAYNWYYTVEAVNDPGYSLPAYTSKWFLPINASNCSLWLDAADPLTIQTRQISQGGPSFVTAWLDKSGNGRNATAEQYTICPILTPNGINSLPVLDFFKPSPCLLDSIGWTVGSTFTSMFVANITGTTAGVLVSVSAVATDGLLLYESGAIIASIGDADPPATAPFVSGTAIISFIYRGFEVTDGVEIWINGELVATSTNSQTDVTGTNGIRIGNLIDGAYSFNNYIGEALWYPYAVDTSSRQSLEGYLAWKWDLQGDLPGGHPYKTSPPLA